MAEEVHGECLMSFEDEGYLPGVSCDFFVLYQTLP